MRDGRGVLVTGLGAVSPCGLTMEAAWDAVVHGISPIQTIRRFPLGSMSTDVAGMVPGFEDSHPASDSLAVRFASGAIREALAHANLHSEAADVLVIGNHGERRAPNMVGPSTVASTFSISEDLAATFKTDRRVAAYGACAAGGYAVALGALAIRSGRAEVAICVGVDALLNDFDFFQFASFYVMTTRACLPEEASCPFDARRDGFVLSEGAACLVLESYDHASRRSANPLARVEGIGISQNAFHMVTSPPDGEGPRRAMQMALDDAGLGATTVDYINAHGTSTRDNDWCETLAIKKVFGSVAEAPPVSSTKGVTGHLMAGAGALEAAFCVRAICDGIVPPTLNYGEEDPRCDLDYVPGEARTGNLQHVLTNCFGFGGHNVALVLGVA